MRYPLAGLLACSLLLATAGASHARCGDRPGDASAVAAVAAEAAAGCDCCGRPAGIRPLACLVAPVREAVTQGRLPRRCFARAVRAAKRLCVAACPPPRTCQADADCDDGNGCTADTCTAGTCTHACLCVGPVGEVSCCPGPAATCTRPTTTTTLPGCASCRYFTTCGGPVCGGPVERSTGVAACTDQQVGTPCSPRGATCDPGSGCGRLLLCTETDPTLLGCPISARRYKRNVQYLGDTDVRRLHDQLLKLRLATYQYKTEDAASPDHLGFIIDDVGRSPAVGADGTRVDLYGYASMAVAAIQAQAREIDTLKREVAALRAEGTQAAKPTR